MLTAATQPLPIPEVRLELVDSVLALGLLASWSLAIDIDAHGQQRQVVVHDIGSCDRRDFR